MLFWRSVTVQAVAAMRIRDNGFCFEPRVTEQMVTNDESDCAAQRRTCRAADEEMLNVRSNAIDRPVK